VPKPSENLVNSLHSFDSRAAWHVEVRSTDSVRSIRTFNKKECSGCNKQQWSSVTTLNFHSVTS